MNILFGVAQARLYNEKKAKLGDILPPFFADSVPHQEKLGYSPVISWVKLEAVPE